MVEHTQSDTAMCSGADRSYEQKTKELWDRVTANVDRHQFLGAGAGAGKTTILVTHYLHLLEQGLKPAQLVAVTFTEKAAAELKERLRTECRNRATTARAAGDQENSGRWEGHLHDLETAPIGTIHSLCARILRENALVIGLDPAFTVLDETDSQLLLDEVVRTNLMARLADPTAAQTAALLVVAHGYSKVIGWLVELVENRVQLETVLADDTYNDPQALLDAWERRAREYLLQQVQAMLKDPQWCQRLSLILGTRGPEGDRLEQRRQAVASLLETAGAHKWSADALKDELCKHILETLGQVGEIGPAGNEGSRARWERIGVDISHMREALAAFLTRNGDYRKLAALYLAGSERRDADLQAARLTCALVAELRAAVAALTEAKQARSALDFDDLLEQTRRLWREHPSALQRWRARVRHLMIDEFQDTNDLQVDALLPIITGSADRTVPLPEHGPRLLVVGDAKQSIYRFRNADVTVFNRTRTRMKREGSADDELTRNYRSSAPLLEVFNHLFAHEAVMGEQTQRPDWEAYYSRMHPDRGRAPTDQSPVEVHLVFGTSRERGGGADEDEGRDDTASGVVALRQTEARWIAQRIAHLLQSREVQVGHKRRHGDQDIWEWEPVRPGDIALLFRSMTDVHLYERELRKLDLPYYLVSGRGFYAAQEVQDVVHALRALENPLDDVALVGALRSPLFALSDETLYWLASKGSGRWRRRLQAAAEGDLELTEAELPCDQRQRVEHAHRILRDLSRRRHRMSLSALIQELLDVTGVVAVLGTQFGGRQMVSNLRKLVELAGEFELSRSGRGHSGLRDFLEYVKTVQAQEVREQPAPVEEETGDVIKLVTIHSAKGLEWPVVILPDASRKERQDRSPVRWHRDLGLVVRDQELVKSNSGDGEGAWPIAALAIKDRNDAEKEAEWRRLFYVAATRARDLLIISGVAQVNQDGKMSQDTLKSPLAWCNEAFEGVLWQESGNEHGERHWEWVVDEARLSPVAAPRTSDRPHGVDQLPVKAPEVDADILRRQLRPVEPRAAGQWRFTATELSAYAACPRMYELLHVLGMPPGAPAFPREKTGEGLSDLELGTVVHQVLQLVGSGGMTRLDDIVPENCTTLCLDTRLDARAARTCGAIRARVAAYLQHELYRRLVAGARRLRSEVALTFPLDTSEGTVIVEGVADALVESPDGSLHVIDYKTGTEDPSRHLQYQVQVGLYCHAIHQATGQWPATANLVYLGPENPRPVALEPVAQVAQAALSAAQQAVEGIRRRQFLPRTEKCSDCPMYDCEARLAAGSDEQDAEC